MTIQDGSPNNNQQKQKTFTFDKFFQEKIVQAMLMDRIWAAQFAEVVDINYFEFAYLRKVSDSYLTFYKEYKEFPSIALLAQVVATDLKHSSDSMIRGQVHEFLIKAQENKDLGDLGYIKDKSLDFCRKAGLQKALEQSVELISTEKYERVVDIIKNAITAGVANSVGLDLTTDIDVRYSETFRKTIATGIPELDQRKILNGGLGAGEIGVVVAPTGVGKSHMLVHIGSSALKAGKNVLHYTFELNERAIGIRYDSHLLDIDNVDCYDAREKVKQYYIDNAETLGQLKIKYYSTGSATINTLRSHIQKLEANGFKPDLIIVDYAGIMRSTEKYELLRLELKKIFEELRGFANETDTALWTACQSNKEGSDKDYVDLNNMAEAYGQAAIADFVIGLSRKSLNKSTGIASVFIAKNRAGKDGILYQAILDTARSKLKITQEGGAADKPISGNNNGGEDEDMKKFFRKKIRDFQNGKKDEN